MTYCCKDFEKFRSEPELPIIIKRDLSVFYLGQYEAWTEDESLDIKFKFCPFCGAKLD